MTPIDKYNTDDYSDDCGIPEWVRKDQDDRCLCMLCYPCTLGQVGE